jgi:DNA/RNA endonuclease YhcR with UshA esterase domain
MKLSLLQISLIISLVGIFILISIANLSPPDSLKISEINSNQLNKNIIISGQITNIMDFEESNFQIITLKDSTGEIQATINKVINLNKNQNITIIGKITEYRGELQINTNKIINSFS